MSGKPEIVVYGPPQAPFTDKVLRALTLKKLEHTLVEPSGPEDYRRWSPETGMLPVADLDGERVADSARILDRLDELYPEPPLVAADPKVAESQRRLEIWAEQTFFFYWDRFLRDEGEQTGGAGRLARFGILGPGERGARDARARYGAEFEQRIADLANFLGDRPFFYADRISRADISVASFLEILRTRAVPGADALLARHPTLLELQLRVDQETR